MSLGSLHEKWTALGWDVMTMNGNDMNEVTTALDDAKKRLGKGKPVMILMKTGMGHGVDFMMGSHHWHGIAPNDEQLKARSTCGLAAPWYRYSPMPARSLRLEKPGRSKKAKT